MITRAEEVPEKVENLPVEQEESDEDEVQDAAPGNARGISRI